MKLINKTPMPQSPRIIVNGKQTYVTMMPNATVGISGILDPNWEALNPGIIKTVAAIAPTQPSNPNSEE